MKEFFIEIEDLKKIWTGFLKMDKKNRGYIAIDHLMSYLEERPYSVIYPFMERFFALIDRALYDRCTFEEFLPACCAFALFTRTEMIGFIFKMLDADDDKVLSKVDLMKFISRTEEGKVNRGESISLYPINVSMAT